ncbi:MAG: pilus assembly protein [Kiritimatiellaeota bacterium]|nr:pilus assembly protein [Kiritimatiellota bacterium]
MGDFTQRLKGVFLSLRPRGSRAGQRLIESCLVVVVLCLLLFGMLQVSHLYMVSEVLDYAATAGARAHSVGFNAFMVEKTIQVAAIPASGRMLNPSMASVAVANPVWGTQRVGWLWDFALRSHPDSRQFNDIERVRIPEYLGAEWWQRYGYLNYEAWDNHALQAFMFETADSVEARVQLEVPVRFPFHRAFYGADMVPYESKVTMENHYPMYLQ